MPLIAQLRVTGPMLVIIRREVSTEKAKYYFSHMSLNCGRTHKVDRKTLHEQNVQALLPRGDSCNHWTTTVQLSDKTSSSTREIFWETLQIRIINSTFEHNSRHIFSANWNWGNQMRALTKSGWDQPNKADSSWRRLLCAAIRELQSKQGETSPRFAPLNLSCQG